MRLCPVCSVEFEGKGRAVYCSAGCKRKAKNEKRRLQPKIRDCAVCGGFFEGETNAIYCSEQCRTQASSEAYERREKDKVCKYCGAEFRGTQQRKLCDTCASGPRRRELKLVERVVVCPRCGGRTGVVWRHPTRKPREGHILGNLCEVCKPPKEEKPPKVAKARLPRRTKPQPMSKDQFSKLMSGRMAGDNNPMKRPEVRAKVSASMRLNPQPTKYGRDHHLWKGNRDRAQVIRTRLYARWNKPAMEAADFSCSKCGRRGGRLEVHHVSRSFREILDEQLGGRILDVLSEDEFEVVVEGVVAAHAGVVGVVYCANCHEEVDPRRRLKGKKKDEGDHRRQ